MPGQESAYELLLTKDGHLYLRAMRDVVVDANKSLGAMGNGTYDIDDAARKSLTDGKGHIFAYQIDSANREATFSVGSGSKITAAFKSGPASFGEFFRFLEDNGQVGFKLPCHSWSRASEETQGASGSGSQCYLRGQTYDGGQCRQRSSGRQSQSHILRSAVNPGSAGSTPSSRPRCLRSG